MPSRRKLAVAVTQKIEDYLRAGLDVQEVRTALNNKVSVRHVQRLTRRLKDFGTVSPEPLCRQGRPRVITPEAQEGIVEFLLECDKQATIEEVRLFLEEEYDIQTSRTAICRAIQRAQITRKAVSRCLGMPRAVTYYSRSNSRPNSVMKRLGAGIGALLPAMRQSN